MEVIALAITLYPASGQSMRHQDLPYRQELRAQSCPHLFADATDWCDTFRHDAIAACPPCSQLGWRAEVSKHRLAVHNHEHLPLDVSTTQMNCCHTGDWHRKEAYLPVRLKDWQGSQPACCGFLVCTGVAPPIYWPCTVSPLDRLHCRWQITSCTGVIRL